MKRITVVFKFSGHSADLPVVPASAQAILDWLRAGLVERFSVQIGDQFNLAFHVFEDWWIWL